MSGAVSATRSRECSTYSRRGILRSRCSGVVAERKSPYAPASGRMAVILFRSEALRCLHSPDRLLREVDPLSCALPDHHLPPQRPNSSPDAGPDQTNMNSIARNRPYADASVTTNSRPPEWSSRGSPAQQLGDFPERLQLLFCGCYIHEGLEDRVGIQADRIDSLLH